jgi:multidrug efflux pump subunit AcrA (membrane-fusion protein)
MNGTSVNRFRIKWLMPIGALAIAAAVVWGALRLASVASGDRAATVPTTTVRRGAVRIIVSARGELQGGNSETLTVPMVGGGEIPIIFLREPGELVKPGDVVARFDSTQQEFSLAEAEADLAEAEQQVVKAEADAAAALEESRFALVSAKSTVSLAELEVRKNPVLAAVAARQNDIALQAALNRLKQAEADFDHQTKTGSAGIAMQQAAVEKARVTAENARRTIESMVLSAKSAGYVHVQPNSNQNSFYYGQQMPLLQVGDATRAGQAVAQIPDMSRWEVVARIPEADRGYLAPGQAVLVRTAAVPGREFKGRVTSVGASTGSSWERTFECRIALDETSPELRPGMSSTLTIAVESLENVLWVPTQALFDIDGRSFVYVQTAGGFITQDVTLVRRSESQAVITGLDEGRVVALSSPNQEARSGSSSDPAGVMQALQP